MQSLKDYGNLSYESEATTAAEIGFGEQQLNEWLRGEIKSRFKSLLRVRALLPEDPRRDVRSARVGSENVIGLR
jgi:hypothetical protein